ncbi:MarR family winged helix-turn-helix transcriptional regulator [Streptomyces sp. RKAG293]|uniref:MarR family winged helix-turn-helix transcriptional regulator n=1 Tax=Streptomyces sp. RKAG293 TaxID=2893403 RepID=UPI0020344659|nr:MarR family winged helix-turn-helix transcriptional regulator [Streptomyces sp. RKAG293]MCM2419070.1 MarR family winged helix-turn-helix transcriptional regulator [Streptomyces sp. RKAG293]
MPQAAADLVLHGDLTGKYAVGSYSKLSADKRSVVLRPDRQGESDHGHRITAAIACHVARLGGTFDQLMHLLMPPDHQGGHHARTIELRSGHARARDYVHRVWANACSAISSSVAVESRHHAHEDLASLRDRIETTPWRGERGRTALRVLRAHLNFAETAGGRQHAASERQAAEEAGISRQTLRRAYEGVLKPGGWLRRLRVGHGIEGSTWYLDDGHAHRTVSSSSHYRTTQFPPDRDLEEWSAPETTVTADIDSTVISRLMGHDAFAHRGLGSPGLMVIGALHLRPGQTAKELITTASVSRATAYRTLQRLAAHGVVHRNGTTWALAPHALESISQSHAQTPLSERQAEWSWDPIAQHYATAGIAAQRKALHATERVAYRQPLEQLSEHRSKALVIVRDGRQILVPTPRGDDIPPGWQLPGGAVLNPTTGRIAPEWRVATDGRLILITPADQRTYDELVAAHAEAVNEWESAA